MNQLAIEIGNILKDKHLTLTVAESCTGGLLAKMITDIQGSSEYFQLGVVTYSNEAKMKLLNVDKDLIAKHGAVSEEVSIAMAVGARAILDTDLAVSITGIAGPESDNSNKPVGLVYIALSGKNGIICNKNSFPDEGREMNRIRSAETALAMLKEFLLNEFN